MCIDMCVDMCVDMCIDMCVDMGIDMCMGMCIDMRMDMCMFTGKVQGHSGLLNTANLSHRVLNKSFACNQRAKYCEVFCSWHAKDPCFNNSTA